MADAEICVGTLEDLESKGVIVASAEGRTIAVFAHEGGIYAVDNRCPHMGFPLDRGSVAGITSGKVNLKQCTFSLASLGIWLPIVRLAAPDNKPPPSLCASTVVNASTKVSKDG